MTNLKIDNRKKYFLLIDVETAGGLDNPLVYDLGFAIVDKQGNIHQERSFLIKEIFGDKELMNSAYYAEKVPSYLAELAEGKHELVNLETAIKEMHRLVKQYKVNTVSAYNLAFDLRALKNTGKNIFGREISFGKMETLCIWSLCCEVLYTQTTFQKVAREQGWVSEKGNLRTSAEIGFRYIANQYDFIEEHKGLEDVRIESKLLARALRQKQKSKSGILGSPWQIPNSSEYKEKFDK